MQEKTKETVKKAVKITAFAALAAGAGYGVYRLIEDNFGQAGVPDIDGCGCDAGAGAAAGESLGYKSCDSYGFI